MKSKSTSMGKKQKVAKQCPKCDKTMPVACKSCPCGHQFKAKGVLGAPVIRNVSAGRGRGAGPSSSTASPPDMDGPPGIGRRRTERVRRTRPHFYNSLEFVSTHVRRRRNTSTTSSGYEDPPKRKRGRPRQHKVKVKVQEDSNSAEKEKEKEQDMYANIPTEKALQYAVILAELNCKLLATNFKPL